MNGSETGWAKAPTAATKETKREERCIVTGVIFVKEEGALDKDDSSQRRKGKWRVGGKGRLMLIAICHLFGLPFKPAVVSGSELPLGVSSRGLHPLNRACRSGSK